MNRAVKTAGIVFLATLIHGIITLTYLSGIPYVSIRYIDSRNICAVTIWFFLTAIFYLVMSKLVIRNKNKIKPYLFAVLFGVICIFLKALLDFFCLKAGFLFERFIATTLLDEITTFVFGIVVMCLLFLVIGKRKLQRNWKEAKYPATAVIALVVVYIYKWIANLHEFYSTVKSYEAVGQGLVNLDHYFALEISKFNVLIYVVFYTLFWWLLTCCTLEKE